MSENKNPESLHNPVLLGEIVDAFGLKNAPLNKGIKIIDATLGIAGHTLEFLKKGANVLGLEQDREMLELAQKRLILACPTPNNDWGSYKLIHTSFRNIVKVARNEGFTDCRGILFDLGVSSPQLTSGERGMSFQNDDAELDMRMDRDNLNLKGSDLLNILRGDQLKELFSIVLDPYISGKIAKVIVYQRQFKPVNTVGDFKRLIEKVIKRRGKTHFATKPFLALRIAVNSEIDAIKESLPHAIEILGEGGRLAVITFNSLEDGTVKQIFQEEVALGTIKLVNEKPIIPSAAETENNRRARSAKLRIIEKI